MHVWEGVLKHCYGVMMFSTSTTCINIVVVFNYMIIIIAPLM